MSKSYALQKKKAQDNPLMRKADSGSRSMAPPPFQLKSSDVIQRDDGVGGIHIRPTTETRTTGSFNTTEDDGPMPTRDAEIRGGGSSNKKDLSPLGVSGEHNEMTTHHAGPNATVQSGRTVSGRAELGPNNVHGQIEAGHYLSKIDLQFPRTYDFKLFGEDTQIALNFKVETFVGGEAKTALEARITKLFAEKDPDKITKQDFFDIQRGVDIGVDAFAGAKMKVIGEAKVLWKKKDANYYQGKVLSNISAVKSMLESNGGEIGKRVAGLPEDKIASILTKVLYTGEDPQLLAVLGAFAEGSAGVGAAGGMSFDIGDGKVKFSSKAGATWGLGIGGGVEVALDFREGLLFALANGGEIYQAMKGAGSQFMDWLTGAGNEFDIEELKAERAQEAELRDRVMGSPSQQGLTE